MRQNENDIQGKLWENEKKGNKGNKRIFFIECFILCDAMDSHHNTIASNIVFSTSAWEKRCGMAEEGYKKRGKMENRM